MNAYLLGTVCKRLAVTPFMPLNSRYMKSRKRQENKRNERRATEGRKGERKEETKELNKNRVESKKAREDAQ